MSTWWALCWREWLEHRGGYGWTPLAVLVLIISAALLAIFLGPWNGAEAEKQGVSLRDLIEHAAAQPEATAVSLRLALREIAQPFVLLYFGVTSFVLLGALFDDRKDRTILFWKSLPVSDVQAVLSKLVTAVWFAPLVTIAAIIAAQLFFLIVVSFFVSGSEQISVATLWFEADLPRGIAEWLLGFLTQGLWMLPVWSWLLLVSAVAPKLPILWATLTPLIPIVLEGALNRSTHLLGYISHHLSLIALPSYRELEDEPTVQEVGLEQMLLLWRSEEFWLGIVVAALILAATIYFRRRNNEL